MTSSLDTHRVIDAATLCDRSKCLENESGLAIVKSNNFVPRHVLILSLDADTAIYGLIHLYWMTDSQGGFLAHILEIPGFSESVTC